MQDEDNTSVLSGHIKHVVVLMLENRSFDNLLGWTYDEAERKTLRYHGSDHALYRGLAGEDLNKLANPYEGKSYPPTRGQEVLFSPEEDPHEPYLHVNEQLFGTQTNPDPKTKPVPKMMGFVKDYATTANKDKPLGSVMGSFAPAQAPVLNRLARAYAVSDVWCSSIPSQTNCNRAFAYCGTSLARTDNQGFFGEGKPFDAPTLFDALAQANKSWRVYYSTVYPPSPIGSVSYTQYLFPRAAALGASNFRTIDNFAKDAASRDLPAFTFIEPDWTYLSSESGGLGSHQGNDYHPPGSVVKGEVLVRQVYEALRRSPCWNETLFIITFDEHGGTYDHVPPPWGAMPPWGSAAPPAPPEHDFPFDRLGVRVPTLFISPWIEPNTVVRPMILGTAEPRFFDHTSLIRTVLDWQQVPRADWTSGKNDLGRRTERAPTFGHVATRSTPRGDDALGPVRVQPGQLAYGVAIKLSNASGWYGPAKESLGNYFPTVTAQTHAMPIFVMPATGASDPSCAVMSGDLVRVRTGEAIPGNVTYLATAEDHKDCVYRALSSEVPGDSEQIWQIMRADLSLGPIRYGEAIVLVSTYTAPGHVIGYEWAGYALKPSSGYLTATRGIVSWQVQPASATAETSAT